MATAETRRGRWRLLAAREGYHGAEVENQTERYRGYWIAAAPKLASRLQDRCAELNRTVGGWETLQVVNGQVRVAAGGQVKVPIPQ